MSSLALSYMLPDPPPASTSGSYYPSRLLFLDPWGHPLNAPVSEAWLGMRFFPLGSLLPAPDSRLWFALRPFTNAGRPTLSDLQYRLSRETQADDREICLRYGASTILAAFTYGNGECVLNLVDHGQGEVRCDLCSTRIRLHSLLHTKPIILHLKTRQHMWYHTQRKSGMCVSWADRKSLPVEI